MVKQNSELEHDYNVHQTKEEFSNFCTEIGLILKDGDCSERLNVVMARDHFADAILRLNHNLELMKKRLDDIDSRVHRLRLEANDQNAAKLGDFYKPSFSDQNLAATLFYLSWPVIVFYTMRAFNKHSMT